MGVRLQRRGRNGQGALRQGDRRLQRHTLREQRYFRTWVTRICINTCRSMDSYPIVVVEDMLNVDALPENLQVSGNPSSKPDVLTENLPTPVPVNPDM